MVLRRHSRRLFTECHLTIVGPPAHAPGEAAQQVFGELCDTLTSQAISPVRERVFGPGGEMGEILSVRDEVLAARGLDAAAPATYLSRKPDEDREPLGVQVWGIQPTEGCGVSVETVALSAGRFGRLLAGPGLRVLWMSGITGADDGGRLAAGATAQAERMFDSAEAGLGRHGFAYTDVVRTWIVLRRILDWYAEFNRIRTSFHERRGITGGPDGRPFPASTGIQGRRADEECLMDVLAVQSTGSIDVSPVLRSARQDEPFSYGSGFSRGMLLGWGEDRTVLVSGTASIGPDGRTRHVNDAEAQTVEMLLDIAALLDPLGGSLPDICGGTLYYRDRAARDAFERVTRWLGVPRLPLVPVMADICRPDLLVEIDAEAMIAAPGEARS